MTGPKKILYLTFGILFLALAVVGLLIPVVPGLLFLFCAVYLLGRGSRRVRRFAREHPKLRGTQERMRRLEAVGALERVQVVGLMALSAMVEGAREVAAGVRRFLA